MVAVLPKHLPKQILLNKSINSNELPFTKNINLCRTGNLANLAESDGINPIRLGGTYMPL